MTDQLHNEIMRAVGRLEGKVDGINQRLDGINGTLKNHDEKIGTLSNDVSQIKGKAAIIGSLFGAVAAVIGGFLKDRLKL